MSLSQVGLSEFRRRGERLLDGPICAKDTAIQSSLIHPDRLRPISKTFGFSAKRDVAITAMVAVLFAVSSPSNIAWLVIAVLVGVAVYRMFRGRSMAHISQKLSKRIAPLFTDGNAASAIQMKFSVLRIGTSLDHMLPCAVLPAASMSMCSYGFAPQTAARFCRALKQMIFVNLGTVATFAKTNPKLSVHDSNRGQSAILLVESGRGYGIFKGHRLISFNRWLVGDGPLGAQIAAAALL